MVATFAIKGQPESDLHIIGTPDVNNSLWNPET
jgi:hypothetical protein